MNDNITITLSKDAAIVLCGILGIGNGNTLQPAWEQIFDKLDASDMAIADIIEDLLIAKIGLNMLDEDAFLEKAKKLS